MTQMLQRAVYDWQHASVSVLLQYTANVLRLARQGADSSHQAMV